jgi:hypothetical protein
MLGIFLDMKWWYVCKAAKWGLFMDLNNFLSGGFNESFGTWDIKFGYKYGWMRMVEWVWNDHNHSNELKIICIVLNRSLET